MNNSAQVRLLYKGNLVGGVHLESHFPYLSQNDYELCNICEIILQYLSFSGIVYRNCSLKSNCDYQQKTIVKLVNFMVYIF